MKYVILVTNSIYWKYYCVDKNIMNIIKMFCTAVLNVLYSCFECTHMMLWTDDPCCIFTLFFLMRMLSLQLYTWIQPSSVPSHIVGCKLSVSSVTMDVSHTSESDALRIRFRSSWTPMLIPVPGVPSSPSSSSSLEELLEMQRPCYTSATALYVFSPNNLVFSHYIKTAIFLIWEIKKWDSWKKNVERL